jgi:hypothetical protein
MTLIKRVRLWRSVRRSQVLALVLALASMLQPEYSSGQILSSSGCPQNRIPPAGMVAWWPLDEGLGATAIVDVAGGANNATAMTGTGPPSPIGPGTPVPGFVGNALLFHFQNIARVDHSSNLTSSLNFGPPPPAPPNNKSFSIDAWIKGGTGPILGNFNTSTQFGYSLTFTNKLSFKIGRGFQVMSFDGPTITPNVWNFVAVVVDRTTNHNATLYTGPAGGSLAKVVSSTIPTNAFAFSGLPLDIGGCSGNPGGCIAIDELEIFNRALPQADVKKIFDMGHSGKCLPNP